MKFFIFICLVAVALAKHEVKDQSSSEESANIYHGYKKSNDVFVQRSQDSASSSSSEESAEASNEHLVQSEEQKINRNQQKKIKEFPQDFSLPQFCVPIQQQQTDMNQWAQSKTIHNIPTQESVSIIVQGILKKIIDAIKANQFQQLAMSQFPQAVHPQQLTMSNWKPIEDYTFPFVHYVRN